MAMSNWVYNSRGRGAAISHPIHRITKVTPDSCMAILHHVLPLFDEPCPDCGGTGIVMVAGGPYLKYAYASVVLTRQVTDLPIQIWYLGDHELTDDDRAKFDGLEVQFVNANLLLKEHPMVNWGGWQAKSFAVAYCPFQHVILLDADCHPLVDPDPLFDTPEYKKTGCIMWPDLNVCRKNDMVFPAMALRYENNFQEMEVGQLLIDKKRLWPAVRLAVWMNSHSECFYTLLYGDKDQWQFAMKKLDIPFTVGDMPRWQGWGMIHRFNGENVFRHLMNLKRSALPGPSDYVDLLNQYTNPPVPA